MNAMNLIIVTMTSDLLQVLRVFLLRALCRWQQSVGRLDTEKPEHKQSADDEIAEYLTIMDESADEMRRLKPELAEHEEEVGPAVTLRLC